MNLSNDVKILALCGREATLSRHSVSRGRKVHKNIDSTQNIYSLTVLVFFFSH